MSIRRSSRQPPTPTSASPLLAQQQAAFPLPPPPRRGVRDASTSDDDAMDGEGSSGSRERTDSGAAEDTMDVDSNAGAGGRRSNPARLRSRPASSMTGTNGGRVLTATGRSNSKGRAKSASITAGSGKKKGSGSSNTNGSGHARRGSVSSKKSKKAAQEDLMDNGDGDDGDGDDGSVTRCVCGKTNLGEVLMFQCESCNVWQHGPCVGLHVDIQGDYFCELCRADLHVNGHFMPKTRPSHGRSPSASHHPTRRERQATQDAVKLSKFLEEAGVPAEEMSQLGDFAMPTAHTRRATMMDAAAAARTAAGHVGAASGSGSGSADKHARDSASVDAEGPDVRARSRSAKERSRSPAVGGSVSESKAKRKRDSDGGDGLSPPAVHSPLTVGNSSLPDSSKRRRVSPYESASPSTSEAHPAPPPPANGAPIIRREPKAAPVITTGPPLPGPHVSKPKHPNQYTYRPLDPNRKKEPAQRKVSPTKKTSGPGSGARGKAARERLEREATPLDGGGWGMPEFLSHLQHLLPTSSPRPIAVPISKAVAAATVAAANEDDEAGNDAAVAAVIAAGSVTAAENEPVDGMSHIIATELPTQLEPATRVRFPGKRMTMPDMRKRTKHLIDYLARVQAEQGEVKRRNRTLEEAGVQAGMATGVSAETVRLIEELNGELVAWQDRFGA